MDCLETILFTNVSEDICLDPGMAHGRHENGPFSAATTTVSKMQNKRIYHLTHAFAVIPFNGAMILLFPCEFIPQMGLDLFFLPH